MHGHREIAVRGAREHNLRNVDLTIPHGRLICFTGVSGSGKSSLAFDTIYAEGQRRYLESLSSYARQFIGQLPKPDVDHLSGLSPSISISQKSTSHNPRSTVGTITEIQDFLRVLYARVGTSFCPRCDKPVAAQTAEQIAAQIRQQFAHREVLILAPLIRLQKGQFLDLFEQLQRQGFLRCRVDGQLIELADPPRLEKLKKHSIELVVNRLKVRPAGVFDAQNRSDAQSRSDGRSTSDGGTGSTDPLPESIASATRLGGGSLIVVPAEVSARAEEEGQAKPAKRRSKAVKADSEGGEASYSTQFSCGNCGLSFEPPSPQLLSFNSPQGMCPACNGLGERYTYDLEKLIVDESLSLRTGALELLGVWGSVSKAMQKELRAVSEAYERQVKLPKGYMLRTPWKKLSEPHRDFWLNGQMMPLELAARGRSRKLRFKGLLSYFRATFDNTKNPLLRRQHEKLMRSLPCEACGGKRLNEQASHIRLRTESQREAFRLNPWRSLPEVGNLPLADCLDFFSHLVLDGVGRQIAGEAIKEITARLGFLLEVGLDYLALNRTAPTLSGGESQRIRLASQIGSGLIGVTYVLDEPSIGLHPRDNERLIRSLKRLRDLGNTLLVVEHDEDTMAAADLLVDFGPGPGVRGGRLIGIGSRDEVAADKESLTGDYLSGRRNVGRPPQRREGNGKTLNVRGARHHNLKNVDVEIPLGCFVCVSGVSGSGKSSLVTDILSPALGNALMKADQMPGEHDAIEGVEHLDKIIDIDQSPIGRTPRSNPATYVKVFDEIRNLFAQLPESKRRGYAPGRFSFNTKGGRCSACEGNGSTRLDMEMLADLWVPCPVCDGHRFDRETLEVRFKDASIAKVLEMDVQEALGHFANVPKIAEKLQTLHDVGLDYIKLGQPSPTLSGGEAQRIKLAKELSRRSTGRTLYLLDEPTTGLHFHDISMLLAVLQKLVDLGNTVLVVEHNLDLIQAADWVIDLGPEGGDGGGRVVCVGRPEQVAENPKSYTGVAMAQYFATQAAKVSAKPKRKTAKGKKSAKTPASAFADAAREIIVRGARQHNLRSVDLTLQREAMTVFCGRSGSGKTSLAMETIYAEGQRRYVESLSSYARQFVGQMAKPAVDQIHGLSPAVALEQKNLGHTPRSTVGTVTEIYDYLRVFMTRAAQMRCPACKAPVTTQTIDQIVGRIMRHPDGTRAMILAPIVDAASYDEVEIGDAFFERLRADGFARVRIDGETVPIDPPPRLDAKIRHDVQVVVDRVAIGPASRSRVADSVEQALRLSSGRVQLALAKPGLAEFEWPIETHSQFLSCQECGRSYAELTPHHFSFNTPIGWCGNCQGLGRQIGTNLDALIDPTLSLRQSGLQLWPDNAVPLAAAMTAAVAEGLGIDADAAIGSLTTTERNQLLFGSGDRWFKVSPAERQPHTLSFQYRGLLPALELASRSSPALRARLESYVAEVDCLSCGGSRVRPEAANAVFKNLTIVDLVSMPLGKLLSTVRGWELDSRQKAVAGELLQEVEKRLAFLAEVGLEYLTLGRAANTLSGGEAQRIRLAAQLGSGLCGVLYVLDEPTIGLHPRDNHRLIAAMHRLRDLGNTLLVVEHDRDVIAGADQLCDFGPGSGHLGGQVVAAGPVDAVREASAGVTGPYLSGERAIAIPGNRRRVGGEGARWLSVRGARMHTLRHIDVAIPLSCFTAITGPSGSGKSSLVNGILYPALAKKLHRAGTQPGPHDAIEGLRNIDKVVRVDQSPLGSSPASTPATYTGVFDEIRQVFARLPRARETMLSSRDFSFNVPGGRCEKCEGNGQCKIEMHFLPDVWVECDACHGRRYNADVLSVRFQDKSIDDVLRMSIAEAAALFATHPRIARVLNILDDVGLGYLSLGQSAPTLSGGEAQRVKLAADLARPATGRTLYLFDEPTTGLHFDDIAKLLEVFHRLVDQGNTVVVIEHNADVIKCADWVIDLGPEAGWDGGQLVFAGTPEGLVEYAATRTTDDDRPISYTGIALRPVLEAGPYAERVGQSATTFVPETLPSSEADFGSGAAVGRMVEALEALSNVFGDGDDEQPMSVDAVLEGDEILGFTIAQLTESNLFDVFEPSGSRGITVKASSAASWFCRLQPNRRGFSLTLQVPVESLNQLTLPDVKLPPGRPMANGPYQVTRGREWATIELEITDDTSVEFEEFGGFLEMTSYAYYDAANGRRVVFGD